MARIFGPSGRKTLDQGWYKVDMVEGKSDGKTIGVLFENLVYNRRHPKYWWHLAGAVAREVIRRVRRRLASLLP